MSALINALNTICNTSQGYDIMNGSAEWINLFSPDNGDTFVYVLQPYTYSYSNIDNLIKKYKVVITFAVLADLDFDPYEHQDAIDMAEDMEYKFTKAMVKSDLIKEFNVLEVAIFPNTTDEAYDVVVATYEIELKQSHAVC